MSLFDDLILRCRTHWKFLLFGTLVPTAFAGLLSLFLPKFFLSQTSVLPVNAQLSDKARFSGEDIAELYSAFGTGDDLDRIFAAASAERVFRKLTDSFQLIRHFGLEHKGNEAAELASKKLRKRIDIEKSTYGELRVRVWDRDPALAAAMANAVIQEVENMHHELYRNFYAGSVASLKETMDQKTAAGDSLTRAELDLYRKSITEFSMAMHHPPPAVMVMEKAMPTARADRPKIWLNILATFMVSLFVVLSYMLFQTRPKSAL